LNQAVLTIIAAEVELRLVVQVLEHRLNQILTHALDIAIVSHLQGLQIELFLREGKSLIVLLDSQFITLLDLVDFLSVLLHLKVLLFALLLHLEFDLLFLNLEVFVELLLLEQVCALGRLESLVL